MKMGALYTPPDQQQPAVLAALDRIGAERLNADAAMKQMRVRREVAQLADDFRTRHVAMIREYAGEADRVPDEQMPAFSRDFQELCGASAPPLTETLRLEELWARDRQTGERVPIDVAPNDVVLLRAVGVMEPEPVEEAAEQEPAEKPAPARKRKSATAKAR